MTDFLTNLINRHRQFTKNVEPRLVGRFEPDTHSDFEPAENVTKESPQTNKKLSREPVQKEKKPKTEFVEAAAYINKDKIMPIAQTGLQMKADDEQSAETAKPEEHSGETAKPVVDIDQKITNVTNHQFSSESAYQLITKVPGDIDNRPEQENSIKLTKLDDPEHTDPINTQEGFINHQSDLQQPVFSKVFSDIPVNLSNVEPVIIESQHGEIPIENADALSYGLLGTPSRLSQQHNELHKRYLVNGAQTDTEPVINVTIGCVEVKATNLQAEKQPKRLKKPSGIMSLDMYLHRRTNEGNR